MTQNINNEPVLGSEGPDYGLRSRLWVTRGGSTYLGLGRVRLLEEIGRQGSIAAAARAMGMGYRHAWRLVSQMNALAPVPLVDRVIGGRGGGGTQLTSAGRLVIAQYHEALGAVEALLSSLTPPGTEIGNDAATE